MKNQRQLRILDIIASESIETQEDLLKRLAEEGFRTTQATISRDIKELHLHKIPMREGGYRYAVMREEREETREREKYKSVLSAVLISAAPACNIAVIKTLPGTASAAGAALESMDFGGLIGTLAGDDTLLCLFGNDRAAFDFCSRINSLFLNETKN